MSGIPCGLMVVMQMNCYSLVQNRDGVCFIVHAVILNVPTQTQLVDVHLASQTVKYGLEQKGSDRYQAYRSHYPSGMRILRS